MVNKSLQVLQKFRGNEEGKTCRDAYYKLCQFAVERGIAYGKRTKQYAALLKMDVGDWEHIERAIKFYIVSANGPDTSEYTALLYKIGRLKGKCMEMHSKLLPGEVNGQKR
jgi:hypothetical protein